MCGQSYPNSKYLFWKFRHVRGQWKNIFHFVFPREEFLRLLGTLNGNSIKCIFGKLSARNDRRLQKQGVIQVKLREKVGFSAWTRLVKHRLCLQHSVCMLLTVCSLGHTSKWLTKVEGWNNSVRESLMMESYFMGTSPYLFNPVPPQGILFSEHKDTLRETMIIISIIFVIRVESQRPVLFVADWLIVTSKLKAFPKDQ